MVENDQLLLGPEFYKWPLNTMMSILMMRNLMSIKSIFGRIFGKSDLHLICG